ncbi:MAG: stage II sporulation protein R [Bacillota bacterium]|nr:stage II sporulation protein R [Bacillota bacterium]
MKKFFIRLGMILLFGIFLFTCMALAPVEKAPERPGTLEGLKLEQDQAGPARGIIRFHVIAADNNSQQQELKLKVRDAVLAYLQPELQNAPGEAAAAAYIEKHLSQIEEVAAEAVGEAGFSEPVQVIWGVSRFPVKVYGPLVFPPGPYRALKIVIGSGAGRNWWCVLFPPLCYVDLTRTSQELVGEALDPETVSNSMRDGHLPGASGKDTNLRPGKAQTRPAPSPRFAWKAGEWFQKTTSRSLISWLWPRRS